MAVRINNKYVLALVLVLVEVLISLPYLFKHPTFAREDWESVYRARNLGIWNTVDAHVSYVRPGVRFIYPVIYGIAINNVLLGHVISILLAGVVAALVMLLASSYIETKWAFVVGLVWVVLPTHLSVDHWIAATNITLSAALTLAGLLVLTRSLSRRSELLAAILFGLAVFSYEACTLVIVVGVLVIAFHKTRGFKIRALKTTVQNAWALVVPLAGALFILSRAAGNRQVKYASPLAAVFQNVGIIHEVPTLAVLIALLVVVGSAYLLLRARLVTKHWTQAHWMVAIGAVVAVAGILPFLGTGFDVIFVGVGDRANYITSIGVALILTGLVRCISLRYAGAVVVVIVLAALVPIHINRSTGWANENHVVMCTGDKLLKSGAKTVTLGPSIGHVPGENLGLTAHFELMSYLESGWHYPAVTVNTTQDPSVPGAHALMLQGCY